MIISIIIYVIIGLVYSIRIALKEWGDLILNPFAWIIIICSTVYWPLRLLLRILIPIKPYEPMPHPESGLYDDYEYEGVDE